jgi:POT family proton-dependent oligopeptide transporter
MGMNTRVDATAPQMRNYQSDRAFLGHPRGLGYLAFSEGWERFSYYGMTALLALYSAQYLFKPGHIGNIWGFAAFRQLLEILFGPLTPLGMGGAIAALYGALVYLTPLLGGFVADRFIGRTYAVIFGAATMAVGHFCMTFDQTYLVALGCILIGSGFFKGNLAAQVGDLYAPGDLRRADAFQIYVLAIQIAVIVSPIVCGFLGQKIAWHFGFGAAGVGMLIGLGTYISGRRWLPAEPPRKPGHVTESRPRLVSGEGKRIAVLVMLIPVLACAYVGNQEIFAAYELWGDAHYQLVFFHWAMPASFLISLDAIVSTVTLIGVVAFWRWWGVRHREPDEITKITIGTFLASLAPLSLSLGAMHEAATGEKIGLGWALGFHLLNDIGFANLYPVGLALFSRVAPKAVNSTMMAGYLLSLFLAGMLVTKLATLLDKMSGGAFWGMHAAIVAGAGVVFLIARAVAGQLLAPVVDPEAGNGLAAAT